MYFNLSPKSSPSSPSLSIGFPSSGASMASSSSTTSRSSSTSSTSTGTSSESVACAYPSWPIGTTFATPYGRPGGASSYISDEDLFGIDDSDCPGFGMVRYLDCAPSPPRDYAMPPAPAALAPLYALAKAERKSRKKASRKLSSQTTRLTPIVESPLTPG